MPSFSPEKWFMIPTNPEFGSLTDGCGGVNFRPVEDEERTDIWEEVSMGAIEIHADKEGLNFLADDLGVGLFYSPDGQLSYAGVDIGKYLNNFPDDVLERMGGENINELLRYLDEIEHELVINFDYGGKSVSVVDVDERTGEAEMLASSAEIDYAKSTLLKITFDEFVVGIGFKMVEDVFSFGLMVTDNEYNFSPDTKMMTTRILADCNFRTFLGSFSANKYDELTRRIFMIDS